MTLVELKENIHSKKWELKENIHSKKCWVVLTQYWVKYGQTQPLG